jgi:hypothetical protein
MERTSLLFIALVIILGFSSLSFARKGFGGGGGGVVFNYLSLDLGPINEQIVLTGMDEFKTGFFCYGGRGYGYVSKNMRIGGMGAGGSVTTSQYFAVTTTTPEMVKEAEFSMNYGGVTLEYIYDAPMGVQIAAGGMLGWGGITVRIWQHSGPLSWQGIWENYNIGYSGDSYDISNTLDNSLFILSPWVEAGYKVLDWMQFTGKVGYFWSTAKSGNWSAEGSSVSGATKDVDLSNFFFGFEIMFGG